MLADFHVHSRFSDDSTEPMENVVQQALARGIAELCFTDHVDYGIKADPADYRQMSPAAQQKQAEALNVDYPAYFARIAGLKEKYNGQITLRQGLEFGMQTHTIPAFEALFHTYDLDFVILSCHQVEDKEFWNGDFQWGKTAQEVNERYYQEIYSCVRGYKNYSVLGHLDMIQRYNTPPYPFAKSRDMIAEILRTVIADGKGIEVNTSSFRYSLADWTPGRDILKLYRDLGGRVLTIGSDCHSAGAVGDRIGFMQAQLHTLGFTHFCTFKAMQPAYHPL